MAKRHPIPEPHPEATPRPDWTHRWSLRRILPDRHGKLCRIVPREFKHDGQQMAGVGSWWAKVTVEFQDGVRVEASRMSLRSVTYATGKGSRTGRPKSTV